MDRFMTTEEVAETCRTVPATVRYWDHIGKLRGFKLGRRKLYAREDVEAFIAAQRAGVPNDAA